jgi:hypothetical protein
MKKAVWAVLIHSSDIANEEDRHKFCPRATDSWCMWWSDKLTPGQNKYKKKLSLPIPIKTLLVPIFRGLSDDKLLNKCLHMYTQNDNESINAVIWKKCPKDIFVSKQILELAVASAVIEFNGGSISLQGVYKDLGLNFGVYVRSGLYNKDSARIDQSARKSSENGLARRKKLRSISKKWCDKETEAEGDKPAYGTGIY